MFKATVHHEFQVIWKYMHTMDREISNTGSYAFSPASNLCEPQIEGDCDWHVGAIKVTVYGEVSIEPEHTRWE